MSFPHLVYGALRKKTNENEATAFSDFSIVFSNPNYFFQSKFYLFENIKEKAPEISRNYSVSKIGLKRAWGIKWHEERSGMF